MRRGRLRRWTLLFVLSMAACAGASSGDAVMQGLAWKQMNIQRRGKVILVGGPVVSGASSKLEALRMAMDAAAVEFLRYSGVDLRGETEGRTTQAADKEGITAYREEFSMSTRSLIRGVLRRATAREQRSACHSGLNCEPTCSAAVLLQVPASEYDRLAAEKAKGPVLSLLVALNQKDFQHGDPVTVTLTTNRDAHVVVLALDGQKKWQRLFPNECSTKGKIRRGEELILPDEKMRAAPCEMVLLAQLPSGQVMSREVFQVIAACDPLDDLPGDALVRKACQGRDPDCCIKKVISYSIKGR